MERKVAVITGANSGIGRETALQLARKGYEVILACRSAEKCQDAATYIRTTFKEEEAKMLASDNKAEAGEMVSEPKLTMIPIDLESKQSILKFTDDFKTRYNRLDVLINNAGIIARNKATTVDGFDRVWGCNYLGPFYLTNQLLELLKLAAPSRIINVASAIDKDTGKLDFDDINFENRKFEACQAYGQSKIANLIFTKELARNLEGTGVTAYCVNPGGPNKAGVKTNIAREFGFLEYPIIKQIVNATYFKRTAAEAAKTSIYCATDKVLIEQSGKYYEDCQEKDVDHFQVNDGDISKRLWTESMKMLDLGATEKDGFVQ